MLSGLDISVCSKKVPQMAIRFRRGADVKPSVTGKPEGVCCDVRACPCLNVFDTTSVPVYEVVSLPTRLLTFSRCCLFLK